MSSQQEAEFVANASLTLAEIYIAVAGVALLVYDILLTNSQEVAHIWTRKISLVTIFFLGIRYVTLLSQVASFAIGVYPGALVPCKTVAWTYYATSSLSNAMISIVGSLRIWAIWGRNWPLLALVLPMSLINVAVDIYQYTSLEVSASSLPPPAGGCSTIYNIPINIQIRVDILASVSVITCEAIILVATWVKTWSIRQHIKLTQAASLSLTELLARDGTIYFLTSLCLHTIALVLDSTPVVQTDPVKQLIAPADSILLCRLLLNLRSYKDAGSIGTTEAGKVTSVRFANALFDNIGASISVGDNHSENDSDHFRARDGRFRITSDELVNNPMGIGMEEDILSRRGDVATVPEENCEKMSVEEASHVASAAPAV